MKNFIRQNKNNLLCVSLSLITGISAFLSNTSTIAIADSGKEHIQQITDNTFIKKSLLLDYLSNSLDGEIPDSYFEELQNYLEEQEYLASLPIYEKITIDSQTVPNWENGCKSYNYTYMSYKAITDKTSPQYPLVNSDDAYTDEETGLRMINERICIALGEGYGYKVGDYVDVILSNGEIFECIMSEEKSNKDTDDTNKYHLSDGSVVEILVDFNYFSSTAQYPEGLKGTIEELRKVDYIQIN